jgi:hypothetical protein
MPELKRECALSNSSFNNKKSPQTDLRAFFGFRINYFLVAAGFAAAAGAAGAVPETVISGFSFAGVLSPMPLSASSCSRVAVFRLTAANAPAVKLKNKIAASKNFFILNLLFLNE